MSYEQDGIIARERIARLEERSRQAGVERRDIRADVKEIQRDSKQTAIVVTRTESKVDQLLEDRAQNVRLSLKAKTGISGGIVAILASLLAALKVVGVI